MIFVYNITRWIIDMSLMIYLIQCHWSLFPSVRLITYWSGSAKTFRPSCTTPFFNKPCNQGCLCLGKTAITLLVSIPRWLISIELPNRRETSKITQYCWCFDKIIPSVSKPVLICSCCDKGMWIMEGLYIECMRPQGCNLIQIITLRPKQDGRHFGQRHFQMQFRPLKYINVDKDFTWPCF